MPKKNFDWLKMQVPLRSNPNTGSPVKSQRRLSVSNPKARLSGQIPTPALSVKSQRRLSGQIPTPAIILKPGAGSSFKFYRTQFIVTSFYFKSKSINPTLQLYYYLSWLPQAELLDQFSTLH